MPEIPPRGMDVTISRFLEHCHLRSYPAKHIIIKEGDPSADLYYMVSGSVSVLIDDQKGREIVLAYLNPGDFFGEIGLFDEQHKRTAFVRARTKCEIAQVSYERFKSLHELFPNLLFEIASQMAIRLRKTSRKVSDLAFTDVKGRVARALLDLSTEPDAMTHPDGMLIRVTRQELGRIVGCSREMVGRVLKSLEEEHLISVAGKSIVVYGTR
ncbi:MAG: cAMP-activated global transcriptional regulator CRP [Gammaproteobacteria bacterium]|nr:cAMP-activated global transcriptional regulator CRP [Gammaproteobacteria bacterium]